MGKRVVITGAGVVNCLGQDIDHFHASLCDGKAGVGPVERFTVPGDGVAWGGEIAFEASEQLGTRGLRPLNRTARLLTVAAKQAIEESGWNDEELRERNMGLISGTTFSSAHTISQFDIRGMTEGPSKASPLDFANTVINAATGQAAIWHGLTGLNTTIAAGVSSSLRALIYGFEMIRNGTASALLAGGVEELCYETFVGFHQADLSCTQNNDPKPIPFAADRNGFCLSEGASLLVLEDAEVAEARGANILCEIKGAGSGFDCQRGLVPSEEQVSVDAIRRTIALALDDAGTDASEIQAVSSSASGDAWYDRAEALGLERVFGQHTSSLPVTAIKSMIGESLGASGAFQTASMLASMRDGRLPGIAGLENVESGIPLAVTNTTRNVSITNALVNSVGFDGNCCSLVIGRP